MNPAVCAWPWPGVFKPLLAGDFTSRLHIHRCGPQLVSASLCAVQTLLQKEQARACRKPCQLSGYGKQVFTPTWFLAPSLPVAAGLHAERHGRSHSATQPALHLPHRPLLLHLRECPCGHRRARVACGAVHGHANFDFRARARCGAAFCGGERGHGQCVVPFYVLIASGNINDNRILVVARRRYPVK